MTLLAQNDGTSIDIQEPTSNRKEQDAKAILVLSGSDVLVKWQCS